MGGRKTKVIRRLATLQEGGNLLLCDGVAIFLFFAHLPICLVGCLSLVKAEMILGAVGKDLRDCLVKGVLELGFLQFALPNGDNVPS